ICSKTRNKKAVDVRESPMVLFILHRIGEVDMNVKEENTDMDVWRESIQQDINDIKQRQQQNESKLSSLESDVHKLEVSDKLQNKEIESLKDTLSSIQEDTSWIRRKITGALITASITAVVTGIVGVAIANIF